jgi:hypothetical protein
VERKSLLRSLGRQVGLICASALVLGIVASPAGAVSAPIHIANTAGEGVYIRAEPNASSTRLGWMPEGASPDYNCFAWGQNINGVPIWFNVNYSGITGYYASYYDDSSYHSNEELTAKYGVPLCGSAQPPAPAPPPAPTVSTPAPAPAPAPTPGPSSGSSGGGGTPGGASLYFSPYPTSFHGYIEIKGGGQAFAPSPATATLNYEQWHPTAGETCPSASSAVPGSNVAGGKLITTLAAWSKARSAPLLFLLNASWASQINYIVLIDPGDLKEYRESKCPAKYPQLYSRLASWLGERSSNKLVVLAGEVTADYAHRVDGHGHAGIQNYLFPAIRNYHNPPGRNIRQQAVVCNYDTIDHESMWVVYGKWMNSAPVSLGNCPPWPSHKVVSWNP